jgi:hypothetical protein
MANHSKKPHLRTLDKINLLIRLELDNPHLSSTQIALLCGLSIQRYSVMKRHPYYQQIHNTYMTGLLTNLDMSIGNKYTQAQKTLEMAVPVAMQGLFKQALMAKDERVKNKAFNDILDRDGRFAKVQRHGLATAEQGGVADDKDNKAVLQMLEAINSVKNTNNLSQVSPPPTIHDPGISDKVQ